MALCVLWEMIYKTLAFRGQLRTELSRFFVMYDVCLYKICLIPTSLSAKALWFKFQLRHASDLKPGILVVALPGACCYGLSAVTE